MYLSIACISAWRKVGYVLKRSRYLVLGPYIPIPVASAVLVVTDVSFHGVGIEFRDGAFIPLAPILIQIT